MTHDILGDVATKKDFTLIQRFFLSAMTLILVAVAGGGMFKSAPSSPIDAPVVTVQKKEIEGAVDSLFDAFQITPSGTIRGLLAEGLQPIGPCADTGDLSPRFCLEGIDGRVTFLSLDLLNGQDSGREF